MNKKAVIILSICAGFLFFKYLAQLFPSLIAVDLMSIDHISGMELGLMASSYYYSYTIMQFGAGYILDKYNVRFASFSAILIVSIGIFIFVHTHSFVDMCMGRILMGFGAAFATILYMKCTAMWVDRKYFGIISSLLATATMLGAAFGSAPVAMLFAKIGWKHGLNLIDVIGFILSVLALLFIHSKKDSIPAPENKSKNSNTGYLKQVLVKKDNWILLFYSGITFIPLIILGGVWGTPFLTTKFAINTTSASFLLSIMFIGVAIGAPIWALLALRFKKQRTLMHIGNAVALLAICLIIYANISYSTTLILAFILGAAISVFMISFQICREINSLFIMGFAVAFINTGEGIIGMFLEPLIGKILDVVKTGSNFSIANYQVALIVLPMCFILSSISILFLNGTRVKAIN